MLEDYKKILTTVEACHGARSLAELNKVISCQVRELLPCEMAAVGIGDIRTRQVYASMNVDYPEEMLSRLFAGGATMESPVFLSWRDGRRPLYVSRAALRDLRAVSPPRSRAWVDILLDFDIGDVAVHGLVDVAGRMTSYFSFGRLTQPMTSRQHFLLSVLIPHLHVAVLNVMSRRGGGLPCNSVRVFQELPRVCGSFDASSGEALTPRELEILKWAHVGKTNAEIAMLLGISEFTVKNHVKNILHKLKVSNRTHAVAQAMQLGLLHLV